MGARSSNRAAASARARGTRSGEYSERLSHPSRPFLSRARDETARPYKQQSANAARACAGVAGPTIINTTMGRTQYREH